MCSLLCFSGNVLLLNAVTRRVKQEIGFLIALATNVGFALLLVIGQYVVLARPFDLQWDAFGYFLLGGLLTTYLGRWFFFLSVRNIGPTRASSMQIANPVFAAIAGWLLLSETLSRSAIGFIGAVLIGLFLTTRVPSRDLEPNAIVPGEAIPTPPERRRASGLPMRDVALALFGALAYGLGNVARGAGVREWEAPIFGSLVGAAAGMTVFLLLHTDIRWVVADIRRSDRVGVWMWVLSGVITISAQMCLIAATISIPVAIAVVIAAAIPVVIIPISLILLRNTENITAATGIGALIIFAGVAGLLLT